MCGGGGCECRFLLGLEKNVGPCGDLNKVNFYKLMYLYILHICMLSPQLGNVALLERVFH